MCRCGEGGWLREAFKYYFADFFHCGGPLPVAVLGAPFPFTEGLQKNQKTVSPTRAKNGALHQMMFKMAQIELKMELKWLKID